MLRAFVSAVHRNEVPQAKDKPKVAQVSDRWLAHKLKIKRMCAEQAKVCEEFGACYTPAAMRSALPDDKPRHTRTSAAWASIALGLAALIVVLIFAIQNLTSVEITFLSLHWTPPLAVLLLLAAALGGLVVFAFGAARIGQLRVQARRARRRSTSTHG